MKEEENETTHRESHECHMIFITTNLLKPVLYVRQWKMRISNTLEKEREERERERGERRKDVHRFETNGHYFSLNFNNYQPIRIQDFINTKSQSPQIQPYR